MLKQSKRDRKKKHEYYKSVLDSQESGNQQNKSQGTLTKAGSTMTKGASKTLETNKESEGKPEQSKSIIGDKASRGKTETALEKKLKDKGATKEQIKKINDLITSLQKSAGIEKDDMSNKIELLKQVEIEFHRLVEQRNVYDLTQHQKVLNEKESELQTKRRTKRNEMRRENLLKEEKDKKL